MFKAAHCCAGLAMATSLASAAARAEPMPPDWGPTPTLAEPKKQTLPTVNIAPAKGWPEGGAPVAGEGLAVTRFASGLDHPRWLHVLPNGDVLAAESNRPKDTGLGGFRGWIMGIVMGKAGAGTPSADRITLLRDTDGDGVAEVRRPFITGLLSPFGMALVGRKLYVANADAIVAFDYDDGAESVTTPGEKLVDLPGGSLNHHWTKNIIASKDGTKLYATVGSNSNVGENGLDKEVNRAAILEVDIAAKSVRLFASGLRNPNGMDWNPETSALWTVVNERDEIGDEIVPDYLTSVKDGAFYGWPWSYYGQNIDTRVNPPSPEKVASAVKPDYALGAHTASLGLAFARDASLGDRFTNGAFIGQHGSWNRSQLVGYEVVFVPFAGGKPSGGPVDVLTGFLDKDGNALGRPVGVAIDEQGGLLVADDVGNAVWRVAKKP